MIKLSKASFEISIKNGIWALAQKLTSFR